jgi:transmembrane sensor
MAATDAPGIDPAIVQRAAEWMARLWSGEVSDEDKAACAAWRAASATHERAWQGLQVFEHKLASVPADLARYALRKPAPSASMARRRALQLLGLGVTVGGLGYTVHGTQAWTLVASDHRTGTGEIRSLTLPDGSQVVLASASAVALSYTGHERLIVLLAGEILVNSAPDNAPVPRPLRVRDRQGTVQALGTRFTVRQGDDTSHVAVLEGAVEVRPARAGDTAMRLQAGQGASFTADAVQAAAPVPESAAAWSRGLLVADAMPLDAFVAELSRYRPGLLRCDPAAASLRVTGVFSLRDTDRALHNLTLALPVAITYRTRYWVTVRAH